MILSFMLIFVPLSFVLAYLVKAPPIWIFLTASLAIVPLAVWIRRGTEQVANKTGPSIGGLLNVTFGNAAELIIALFVLTAGNSDVVKGQITGSIIGNSLLGLGLAILIGTWSRQKLTFNREQAGQLSTMLILVLVGLLLPAIFDLTERNSSAATNAVNLDERLSLAVSVVLILLYIANLVYTLVTHETVFSAGESHSVEASSAGGGTAVGDHWPMWKGLAVMVAATVVTALEAELISSGLEATAGQLGVSVFFLGVVVLAVVGNVAEYVSAIYFAKQQKMSLVMSITVGATIQVALFVAPLLVLVSYFIGSPMDLVFANPIELIAIAGSALVVEAIAKDGEVTWFEGALLVGVYLLFAIAFFLSPHNRDAAFKI